VRLHICAYEYDFEAFHFEKTEAGPMIRSLALHWAARFRHNQSLLRLSSSYASPATLHHATSSSPSAEPVHITPNCIRVCPLLIFHYFIIFSLIFVCFYAR